DETKDLLSVDEVKPIAKEFLRCVSGFLSDVDETGGRTKKAGIVAKNRRSGRKIKSRNYRRMSIKPLCAKKMRKSVQRKANHEVKTKRRKISQKSVEIVGEVMQPASKQIWEDEPWEQHPIVGDGNCLYRSIALIKYRDQELYGLVRDDLMNYLQAHKDEEWNRCFVNVEEYVQQHRKDFVWGNATHLILAARRYDMNFVMFQPNDDKNHFVNYPADFTWGKTELDESKKIGWIRLQKDHFDVVSFDRKENV
uniref:OTU domain-containing protein n=1 Tax=Ditylenchus dipsaci TaxID=166011 RepID=A0A915DR54_9BILA